LKPGYPDALYHKGIIQKELERYSEALETFEKLTQVSSPLSITAWFERGAIYLYYERFEDAIAAFEKVLEFNPGDSVTWYAKYVALRDLKHFDEAITALQQAVKHNSGYARVAHRQAEQLKQEGQIHEASKILLAVFAALSEALNCLNGAATQITMAVKTVNVLHSLAATQFYLNQYDDALNTLDRILGIQRKDANAHYNKACCYARKGQSDLAISTLNILVDWGEISLLKTARTDEDFTSLRGNSDFERLISNLSESR